MTDFTKTKIGFMLALLGALFALHPLVDRYEALGFDYLGVTLKVLHAYALTAALLSLGVYCYGMALVGERPHSVLERLGNTSYALAITVPPLFGGLYVSSLLAQRLDQSHLAWAAPAVAVGLGVGWLVLSQAAAILLRRRLGERDRRAKVEQLARHEVAYLGHARDLFAADHLDLAVVEAYKALEARLRGVLLERGYGLRDREGMDALVRRAARAGILHDVALELVAEVERHWRVAMSSDPLPREAAAAALSGVRHLLATIPLGKEAGTPRPPAPRRDLAAVA